MNDVHPEITLLVKRGLRGRFATEDLKIEWTGFARVGDANKYSVM
jgi:hypothetical protein